MDTFLIGFLSAMVIVFLIAVVVGLVMISQLKRRADGFDEYIIDLHRKIETETGEISRRLDLQSLHIERQVATEVKKLEAMVDSRVNKVESKIK